MYADDENGIRTGNTDGTKLVREIRRAYTITFLYDAWGKAISTTGTLAGTIGEGLKPITIELFGK